jgi:hypothetical protein
MAAPAMGHVTAFTTAWSETTVLLAGWGAMSGWQYALTLLAMVCLAVLSESMVLLERGLGARALPREGDPAAAMALRLARTALYTARTVVRFLLMLAAMTFDVGIFVSIMGGFCIGYFAFSSKAPDGLAGHTHVQVLD